MTKSLAKGSSTINPVDWGKIPVQGVLERGIGTDRKIFYSIHVDIDQKEQAADKIEELCQRL